MALPLSWLRKTHTFLGIFFAPLLLLFIVTGWWQTLDTGDKDDDESGTFFLLMSKLSRVHTDGYYPPQPPGSHSDAIFKALVIALCVALLVSILSGVILAWKTTKKKWQVVTALGLGIAVPVGILFFK